MRAQAALRLKGTGTTTGPPSWALISDRPLLLRVRVAQHRHFRQAAGQDPRLQRRLVRRDLGGRKLAGRVGGATGARERGEE